MVKNCNVLRRYMPTNDCFESAVKYVRYIKNIEKFSIAYSYFHMSIYKRTLSRADSFSLLYREISIFQSIYFALYFRTYTVENLRLCNNVKELWPLRSPTTTTTTTKWNYACYIIIISYHFVTVIWISKARHRLYMLQNKTCCSLWVSTWNGGP